jgi:Ca-activated chloride channel family protein
MTFGAPSLLWLLLLAPVAMGSSAWYLAWRASARRSFGGIPAETRPARLALAASPALLIAAIGLAVFSAARPQFGDSTDDVEVRGIDIIVVLDVSNSMLSTDTEPSRLEAAQTEVRNLLTRLPGSRAGLVIFAAQPFMRSPLTTDLDALSGLVDGIASERGLLDPGSDLGAAINAGARLLADSDTPTRIILVVSDGEDFGTAADSAVGSAAADGIRIYTAGVGSVEGAPVLDPEPLTGSLLPRLDPVSGAPLITRLDSTRLRQLAEAGGGRYVTVEADGAIASLAEELREMEQRTFGSEQADSAVERFQVFAALALLLTDIELMLLLLAGGGFAASRRTMRMLPVAGSALFVAAICGTSVADINEDANRRYEADEYAAALRLYRTAEALDQRPELRANASNALNQLARYEEAIEAAVSARDCGASQPACKPETLTRIEYALGNHYFGATRLLDALNAYRRALLADPDNSDAKANYELAARLLTPTPNVTQSAPQGTPTAGDDGGVGGSGGGTPSATDSTTEPASGGGTPANDGDLVPADPRLLTREQLQRALADALAGIDQEFTPEEAQRILALLEEENRRSIAESANEIIRPEQPDY